MQRDTIFAVIGGDMRFVYLAGGLAADGYTVYSAGTESAGFCEDSVILTDIRTAVKMSNTIIFPLPVMRQMFLLNAPLSSRPIELDGNMFELLSGKTVFAGLAGNFKELSQQYGAFDIRDYYESEELQICNALATAEGAIAIALSRVPFVLSGTQCLVTGYGRIGKVLASKLKALGANVTVTARKPSDKAWIETMGYTYLGYNKLDESIDSFDIIFNTVPHLIFNEKLIRKMKKSSLMIDLASKPGGMDFAAAEKYGINFVFAPGIPGEYSPLSAALVIKSTILSMIEEA
jgi:dipicolinate synthase subunit A